MEDIETIEGVGEVVRVEQDPPGMGVLFRELNCYSKDLIEKLLTKRPGYGSPQRRQRRRAARPVAAPFLASAASVAAPGRA